jgi:curli biogenesis system outer membrane secretion channel CsgG
MAWGRSAVAGLAFLLAACSTSQTKVGGPLDQPLAQLSAAEAPGPDASGLPRCDHVLATVAIAEAEGNAQALMSAGLPRSMAPLVRHLLFHSGCFRVVDRGAAFALVEQERKVRADRGLGTGAGRRPLQLLDFVVRAEIVFAEQTAGTKGVLGGVFGQVLGGVGGLYSRKEAVVMLSLVDADSSEILGSTLGRGSSDSSGLGSLVLASGAVLIDGGWADTPQAKTVAAALVDAWARTQPKLARYAQQRMAVAPTEAASGVVADLSSQ